MQRGSSLAFSHSVLGCLAALAALGLGAGHAFALQPSLATQGHPELELPSGKNAAISQEVVWDRAPRALAGAFNLLRAEVGGEYRASFNDATGVPSRLFGRGVPAKGSVEKAKIAEGFAQAFLERHIALLAPGAHASDFEVVSNDLDATPRGDGLPTAAMRTIGLQQFYVTRSGRRLEVRGGQVSFRFKNDQMLLIGSEALPLAGVALDVPKVEATTAEIGKAARGFVERDFGAAKLVSTITSPFVLPFTGDDGLLTFRVVRSVLVETQSLSGQAPSQAAMGRFEVFVDARTGTPVARRQLLHFAGANLSLHVTTRAPTFGVREDAPALDNALTVDTFGSSTSALGAFTFAGAQSDVIAFANGTGVSIDNQAGANAQVSFQVLDGATFVWDASTDELVDAQLDTLVHARQVRDYAKSFAPSLSFLNEQVSAAVNVNDQCNAFSDGTKINFFKSSSQCENTGRIADVVYHEFGHSIHFHAVIPGVGVFDGALSEGISDYLAATITGDPGTARGFFYGSAPLRDLDPPNQEKRWPENLTGEVHDDGEIIGESLWDLRKALVDKLGPAQGVAQANFLFYQGIRRAKDIPTMYTEVIAADDDDGNLENGTPNICEINRAFALHGLRAYSAVGSPLSIEPVKQDGYTITAELHGLFAQCPEDALTSASLKWRNQQQQGLADDLAMQVNGFQLSAVIPVQPDGTAVQYSVTAKFAGTNNLALPDNAADGWYQFYVGAVEKLYCTDFETDPAADGWTHGLSMGKVQDGADDWEWGRPKGTTTNGDPTEAFSGKKVYGNDLGGLANHNGLYQPDKVNFALSPVVDTTGYDIVRLQYRRWLNVEDGNFDKATIYANGQKAWANVDSNMGDASKTDHTDREWRFQDVDLSPFVSNNQVQVKYELDSDPGKQLGGWTIDDFCVVGVKRTPVDPCAGGGCGGAAPTGSGGGGTALNDSPSGGCNCTFGAGNSESFAGGSAALLLGALVASRRRRKPRD